MSSGPISYGQNTVALSELSNVSERRVTAGSATLPAHGSASGARQLRAPHTAHFRRLFMLIIGLYAASDRMLWRNDRW